MAGGSRLMVTALPDGRSSPPQRLAASPTPAGDHPGRNQGSRTNGGGDAEIDQLTIDQHEDRIITGRHSHKQGGNA
ncbi:hypothetical protein A5756_00880 [Mycobacterium sp. 852002-53434_SCH5985345]|nr:hypothetical protein A5756_00880 [Mycobacterium sp. 852002-53434_SCH5985345]OBF77227.1 hypothetical protein A5750_06750 [Mycobacterium sp. 852002-51613_SCH5001154]OBF90221.1 hypothetical protein A5773_01635 [Mycobacterium sp. 852014-52450_SCH5900713]